VGMDECQSPEPAVGAVCGDTGVGATCGAIGVAGGTAPAPAGPNPPSAWCMNSPGPKLGGGAPWKAAPLKGIPGEPDGGPPPTLEKPGLNIGEGVAMGELAEDVACGSDWELIAELTGNDAAGPDGVGPAGAKALVAEVVGKAAAGPWGDGTPGATALFTLFEGTDAGGATGGAGATGGDGGGASPGVVVR
jgi:hypothetical protein